MNYVVKRKDDGLYASDTTPAWTHLQRCAMRFKQVGARGYAKWCREQGLRATAVCIVPSGQRPKSPKRRVIQLALALGMPADAGTTHRDFSGYGHVWNGSRGAWEELNSKGCACELAHWLLATREERRKAWFGLDQIPEDTQGREKLAVALGFCIGRVLGIPWCREAPAGAFAVEQRESLDELVVRGLVTADEFQPTFFSLHADGALRLCPCGCGRVEGTPYMGEKPDSILERIGVYQERCACVDCVRHEHHLGRHVFESRLARVRGGASEASPG